LKKWGGEEVWTTLLARDIYVAGILEGEWKGVEVVESKEWDVDACETGKLGLVVIMVLSIVGITWIWLTIVEKFLDKVFKIFSMIALGDGDFEVREDW